MPGGLLFVAALVVGGVAAQSKGTPASLLRECRRINVGKKSNFHEQSDFDHIEPANATNGTRDLFYLSQPEQILMEKEHCAVCQIIVENHYRLKGQSICFTANFFDNIENLPSDFENFSSIS